MIKRFFLISIMFVMVTRADSAFADMDCSPLDPRASVSTEKEGKIKASVNTLYRIAKANGSIDGKIKNEIQNLQKGESVTEQGLIKLRTLYLFCGMVANARDLSTKEKANLYKTMMDLDKVNKPMQKKSKKEDSKIIPPIDLQKQPNSIDKVNEHARTSSTEYNLSPHSATNDYASSSISPNTPIAKTEENPIVLEPTWVQSGETTQILSGQVLVIVIQNVLNLNENKHCSSDPAYAYISMSGKLITECLRVGKRALLTYKEKNYWLTLLATQRVVEPGLVEDLMVERFKISVVLIQ